MSFRLNKLFYYLYITLFSLFPHRIMQPGKVFRAIATNFDVLFCVIHSIFWIIHILVPKLHRYMNIVVTMEITNDIPYKIIKYNCKTYGQDVGRHGSDGIGKLSQWNSGNRPPKISPFVKGAFL